MSERIEGSNTGQKDHFFEWLHFTRQCCGWSRRSEVSVFARWGKFLDFGLILECLHLFRMHCSVRGAVLLDTWRSFPCVISLCPLISITAVSIWMTAAKQLTQTAISKGEGKHCWDKWVFLDTDTSFVLWLHIHLTETRHGITLPETLWLAFIGTWSTGLFHWVFGVHSENRRFHSRLI